MRSTSTIEPSKTVVTLWTAALAVCLLWLGAYASTPGADGAAVESLPPSAAISSGADGTLLMFVHPHCPCTAASLTEFEGVLERSPAALGAELVFFSDPAAGPDWVEGRLWRRAGDLEQVRRRVDPGGVLATEFGVSTSGHVLYFDAEGALRFDGGLTAGRGHVGPTLARAALERVLAGDATAPSDFVVFGCGLGTAVASAR